MSCIEICFCLKLDSNWQEKQDYIDLDNKNLIMIRLFNCRKQVSAPISNSEDLDEHWSRDREETKANHTILHKYRH